MPEPPYSSNVANSLIHLYRGEVGRMTLYRIRLDTTTNWAIITAAGVTTFAFGNPEATHAVFLFAMLLVYAFLHLESRRFRVYEVSHHRVRILERYFYHEMLGAETASDWHAKLLQILKEPRVPMSRLDAMGWRLRRNYLWIFGALIVAWAVKLDIMGGKAGSTAEVIARAEVGPFSGWLVVTLVVAFYLGLISLALYATRDYPLEAD